MNPFYESIKKVADNYNFQHVAKDTQRLGFVAEALAKRDFVLPDWRTQENWPFDNDNFVQFLGITTAINFCYDLPCSDGKYVVNWHGMRWSGSSAMAACVMRAIEKGESLLNALDLFVLEFSAMRKIFEGESGLSIPLLSARFDIWREVARVLIKNYAGHFKNLFEAANYKCFDGGKGICERLVSDFPESFYDFRYFEKNYPLHFHKKALLLPLIYYGRAAGSDDRLPQIKDPENLSAPADYQIPRGLNNAGIIFYSKKLEEKIKHLDDILRFSREEIEIRMQTVICMNELLEEINKEKRRLGNEPINMAHLDYRFWITASNSPLPHHRTLTTDY